MGDDGKDDYEIKIGQRVAARLSQAAKARGWTQGEVHMHANQGNENPAVSKASVSALLRGSIANPGVATILPVAQALGLTLDQLLGLAPLDLPEVLPVGDDRVVLDLAKEVQQIRNDLDFALGEIRSLQAARSKPLKPAIAPPKRKR